MRFWPALLLALGVASCSVGPARSPASLIAPSASESPAPRGGLRAVLLASPLTGDEQIRHVLDRLGYGPRPGDVERLRRMGVATYVEQQLAPDALPDGSLAAALRAYPTLAMSAPALVREY